MHATRGFKRENVILSPWRMVSDEANKSEWDNEKKDDLASKLSPEADIGRKAYLYVAKASAVLECSPSHTAQNVCTLTLLCVIGCMRMSFLEVCCCVLADACGR